MKQELMDHATLEPVDLWKKTGPKPSDFRKQTDELQEVVNRLISAGVDFSKLLGNWPTFDKWKCLAAGFASIASVPISYAVINMKLRNQFGTHAGFLALSTNLVPFAVVIPAFMVNYGFVMEPLAFRRANVCPVCLEIRQVSANIVLGNVIPFLIFPLACGAASRVRYGTIINYLKYVWVETKPVLKTQFPLTASCSAFATAGGVYFEQKYVNKIMDMLLLDPEMCDELIDKSMGVHQSRLQAKFERTYEKIKNFFS